MSGNTRYKKDTVLLFTLAYPIIVWFALRCNDYLSEGLPGILAHLSDITSAPFDLTITQNSFKAVFLFTSFYVVVASVVITSMKNYRRREEYGSAKWGGATSLSKKYQDKTFHNNKIFTANVKMGLDTHKHRRNLNTLVVGGSGAGKTRFYAKPNLLQANTSFVVLDPKGELLSATGYLLKEKGYDIRVLDLTSPDTSLCYNPFVYLSSDNDVMKLVTNLIRNTTPKQTMSCDPFWEKSETALLEALILYLLYEAPEEEQNFGMVMDMILSAEVKEDDEEYFSPLDILFERLSMKDPTHVAVKQYKIFKLAAGKTAKSILISLGVRLEKFNLSSLRSMTVCDELHLNTLGEVKTALFAITPDNDTSLNFMVGMLYTQLFQLLYRQADLLPGRRLSIPVHFLMDEFANIALPDEFDKLLATMRSREIFVSIIIQNMAQLKALFEKQWESIVGNCDSLLYLGGNELSTHEYLSKLLGKETIDTNTYGLTKGRSGSYSTNYQQSGRELLTSDEVRMLSNEHALLFIRGEHPILDLKYNLLKHPDIKLTEDGGYYPYSYEPTLYEVDPASITLCEDAEYELLCEEELENEYLLTKGENNE